MTNKAVQAFSFGSNVLKANLNEDMGQSQFIKSGFFRLIFIKLAEASAALLSLLIVYLASTNQIAHLDPITYFKQTPRRSIFIVIGAITLFCYLQDQFTSGEETKDSNGDQKISEKNNENGNPLPSLALRKMTFQLSADFLRIINYFLVFYVLDQDVFQTTTNSHLVITKYCLILLWIMFTLRKLVFWGNILLKQTKNGEIDLYPWETSYINHKNKVEQIQKDMQSKFEYLNLLAQAAHQKSD